VHFPPLLLVEVNEVSQWIVPVVLAIGVLIFAAMWLIFPFIVISKCNEILRALRRLDAQSDETGRAVVAENKKIGEHAAAIRSHFEKLNAHVDQMHETENELSKGMQWMIDNWPDRQQSGR
jgi:hypothetical protein